MLKKERFAELETPALISNLCCYYDELERYDFLKTYYRWNKELLIERWQENWVEKEKFFELLHRGVYNIHLIPSCKFFVIWEFFKKDFLKDNCFTRINFLFDGYPADDYNMSI